MAMNLKLRRPTYAIDREKGNLNYELFGRYIQKINNQLLFKGGMDTPYVRTKKVKTKDSMGELLIRKYEVKSIQRLHDYIFKKKENLNTTLYKTRNTISKETSPKPKRIPKSSSTSHELKDYSIRYKRDTTPSIKTYFDRHQSFMNDSSIGKMHKGRMLRKTSSESMFNKEMMLDFIPQLPCLDLKFSNSVKNIEDPFIRSDLSNPTKLYASLRKECNFFGSKNIEDDIDFNNDLFIKKLFQERKRNNNKFNAKYSVYYIKSIKRKKNDESVNDSTNIRI